MICPNFDKIPGKYPLEPLPFGWRNAEVTFRHRDGYTETRIEIIHLKTEDRYIQEPLLLISLKCLALFLVAVPVYTIVYTLFHLIRTPIATVVNLSLTVAAKQIW